MKRVLLILPNLDLGGTEVVVMNYLRAGVPFDFVVHGEAGYFEAEAKALGAQIFRVPTRRAGFWRNVRAMRALYRTHRAYETVIVCSEHAFAFIELAVAWACGIKRRGAWSHFSDYQGASKIKRLAHFLARPFLRWFANIRLACSTNAGKWLFGRGPVQIVKNAIDLEKFAFYPQARAEMRKALGLGEHQFAIGIIGRLTPVKNHAFALRELALMHKQRIDAVLLFIGDGELREELEAQANERVLFTGAVAAQDMPRYYAALDWIWMPSLHEGFPMTAIEALASGLCLFVSDTITREVAAIDRVRFLPLEEGAWAYEDIWPSTRTADVIGHIDYDIKKEAQRLRALLKLG